MGKRGRPVVFNACKTCKIRRVKCDGARPSCARCRDTGRKCDGYPVPTSIVPSQNRDPRELRSFTYFCDRTSFEICGHYDEEFWRSQAIQLANSQPQLWHMLVAIGALHENIKQTVWQRNAPAMSSIPPVFALQQCNKAISLLTAEASGAATSTTMLTSCILFMAFEMLQSNLESSLNHLRSARSILDAWVYNSRNSGTFSERELIEEHLAPIIHRFSESCDGDLPSAAVSYPTKSTKQSVSMRSDGSLPQTFFSLNHASRCLHDLLDKLFLDLSGLVFFDEEQKMNTYNESHSTLCLWWERYQHFLITVDKKMLSPSNKRRLALLEVHYFSASIMYAAQLFNNEMIYDSHLTAFRNIIEQCRRIIDLEKEQAKFPEPRLTMSFDLGIIMPLWLTGCRCRDPSLRREAHMLLMSSPRREGIWLSWMTGLVVDQVISIEESGLENPQSCSDIPLENRIELMDMHYNPRRVQMKDPQPYFKPGVELSWISASERDDPFLPPQSVRRKSIELPITRDDRPGPRPYWVVLPKGPGFSSWKMLLGKKVFSPPIGPDIMSSSDSIAVSQLPDPTLKLEEFDL